METLVTESDKTDTEGMPDTQTEPLVDERDRLVKDVEMWLTASVHRTVLEPRDIRDLQTLLIDVRAFLTDN